MASKMASKWAAAAVIHVMWCNLGRLIGVYFKPSRRLYDFASVLQESKNIGDDHCAYNAMKALAPLWCSWIGVAFHAGCVLVH